MYGTANAVQTSFVGARRQLAAAVPRRENLNKESPICLDNSRDLTFLAICLSLAHIHSTHGENAGVSGGEQGHPQHYEAPKAPLNEAHLCGYRRRRGDR